jgi:ParB family chromosome partitioning protein
MKLEAIKRQGERTDLKGKRNKSESTSRQIVGKLEAGDFVGQNGETARTVQRYIRLNELNPKLQRLVDERKMGITPAVEVSYLSHAEQDLLMETIESEQTTPSLSQAQKMRKMSKEGNLNEDTMLDLMQAQKKPEGMDIVLRYNDIKEFFPKAYTPLQMKNGIMKLLENFRQAQIKRARNQQSR